VQIAHPAASRVRDFVQVATLVALRVGAVYLSDGVEGLVDIADVVDDHTQNEGAPIVDVGENLADTGNVVTLARGVLQKAREVSQGLDYIDCRLFEVEVVNCGTLLIKVGNVDKVPVGLESSKRRFDVIGKRCALCERVVAFVLDKI